MFSKIKYVAATAALVLAVQSTAQETETDKGKLSYAIGYQIGSDFNKRALDVDVETVLAAIRDAVSETDPTVPREEMVTLLRDLEQKIREEQLEKFKALAEKNKGESEKFLSENKTKRGITELPSGVQYRIIEDGTGSRPGLESDVTVHYRGSLISGFEFDSSFARGVPATFKVSEVLRGWQEVIPLMRMGGKWQVFVPPELAYGERGQPPIGPNETLIFDLHLIEVKS